MLLLLFFVFSTTLIRLMMLDEKGEVHHRVNSRSLVFCYEFPR